MKFVIVDDNEFFRRELGNLIKSMPGYENAEVIFSGFDGGKVQKTEDDDVFFLDIDDGNDENAGIKLACKIRETNARAHIVFITSHSDKIRQTLAGLIRPSEFIVKPLRGIEKEKLFAFLRLLGASEIPKINLKCGAKHFDVTVSEILYIHREDRKTAVYTENAFFQVRQSLSAIMDMLDDNFIVVDKGTAINIKKARAYDPEQRLIRMENNEKIYCSRDKARIYRDVLLGLEVI